MTYTPIVKGTLNWDVPVNAAFTDQDSRITTSQLDIAAQSSAITALQQTSAGRSNPSDLSMYNWNWDPQMASGSSLLIGGQLTMLKVKVTSPTVISNVIIALTVVGSGLTVGANFAGLYDQSGTLLSGSVDQFPNWTSTGLKTVPLITPQSVVPGDYYVGVLANASTTLPQLMRTTTGAVFSTIINANQSVSIARYATTGAGLTTLPSSVTMSGRALLGNAFWAALS